MTTEQTGSWTRATCDANVKVPAERASGNSPSTPGALTFLRSLGGCGGIDPNEATEGEGISIRDGSLGRTMSCLTAGSGVSGMPVSVGLRYASGRKDDQDGLARGNHATDYFWHVSYSRRITGSFPKYDPKAPWKTTEVPNELFLHLETGETYSFKRDGTSLTFHQPGVPKTASAAVVNIATQAHPEFAGENWPGIKQNDILVRYPDGTMDVFETRWLSLIAHIDSSGNRIIVGHNRGSVPATETSCSAPFGFKRIASYPAGSSSAASYVDLKYSYRESLDPNWTGPSTATPDKLGFWRLDEIKDHLGRTVEVKHDLAGNARRISGIVDFKGAGLGRERETLVAYNAEGLLRSITQPSPSGGTETIELLGHGFVDTDDTDVKLARVAEQVRPINGRPVKTTFRWGAGTQDFRVFTEAASPWNGFERAYAHETWQYKPSAKNRVVASWNVNAADSAPHPVTTFNAQGLPTRICTDATGPSWDLAVSGDAACTRIDYEPTSLLPVTTMGWDTTGTRPLITRTTYKLLQAPNRYAPETVTGPFQDEPQRLLQTHAWGTAALSGGLLQQVTSHGVTDVHGATTTSSFCSAGACPSGALRSRALPGNHQYLLTYGKDGADTWTVTTEHTATGLASSSKTDSRGCTVASTDENRQQSMAHYEPASLKGPCMPDATGTGVTGAMTWTSLGYNSAGALVRSVFDTTSGSPKSDVPQNNSNLVSLFANSVVDDSGSWAVTSSTTDAEGSAALAIQRSTRHTTLGLPVGTTTTQPSPAYALSSSTTYDFRADGTRVEEVSVGGNTATLTYDTLGRLTDVTSPEGRKTHHTYSKYANIRLASDVGPWGQALRTVFAHYIDGSPKQTILPNGQVVAQSYDPATRTASATRGGVQTLTKHDALGRAIETRTLESGAVTSVTSSEYGPSGDDVRPTATTVSKDGTAASARTTRVLSFSPFSSLPATVQDPEGNTTSYAYNQLAELISTTSGGSTVSFGYDHTKCLRTLTQSGADSGGPQQQVFFCDKLGRRTAESVAGTAYATKTWSFFPNSTVHRFTDVDGSTSTHALDASGRVSGVAYVSGAPTARPAPPNVSLSYDTDGLLETARELRGNAEVGSTRFAYDPFGRLEQKARRNGPGTLEHTLRYRYGTSGYDVGALTGLDFQNGARPSSFAPLFTRYHDNQGRIAAQDLFGDQALRQSYAYAGNRLLSANPSSPAGSPLGLRIPHASRFDYDARGLLSRIAHTSASAPANGVSNLLTLDYAGGAAGAGACLERDNLGNVRCLRETWNNEPELRHTYAYDGLNRLQSFSEPALPATPWNPAGLDIPAYAYTHAFDSRSNLVSFMGKARTFNSLDQLSSPGYRYDPNGNLTQRPDDDLIANGSFEESLNGTTPAAWYAPAGSLSWVIMRREPSGVRAAWVGNEGGRAVLAQPLRRALAVGERLELCASVKSENATFVQAYLVRRDAGTVTNYSRGVSLAGHGWNTWSRVCQTFRGADTGVDKLELELSSSAAFLVDAVSLRVLKQSVAGVPSDNLATSAGTFEDASSSPPPNLIWSNNAGSAARVSAIDAAGSFALRISNGPTTGWTAVSWPIQKPLTPGRRVRVSALVRASDSSVPAPFLELFLNDNSGTTLLKLGLVERLNTKWQRVQLETSLPPDVANKTGSLVAILGAFDGSNVGSDVLLDDVSISELP